MTRSPDHCTKGPPGGLRALRPRASTRKSSWIWLEGSKGQSPEGEGTARLRISLRGPALGPCPDQNGVGQPIFSKDASVSCHLAFFGCHPCPDTLIIGNFFDLPATFFLKLQIYSREADFGGLGESMARRRREGGGDDGREPVLGETARLEPDEGEP